jgi:lipid A 3-O-deacylase
MVPRMMAGTDHGFVLWSARRIAASAMALVCALAAAGGARAEDFVREVKIGVLYHDMPYIWSGFQLEQKSVDINIEALFSPSLPFLIGQLRPAIGGTVSTVGATSHAYLDARWELLDQPVGLYLAVGFGGAIHDGDLLPDSPTKKALGSRTLFHFPAEIGWRFDDHNSVSVYFEHTSNAWFARYNEGLDRLGVRYGYKF